jgi:hypothetical protein
VCGRWKQMRQRLISGAKLKDPVGFCVCTPLGIARAHPFAFNAINYAPHKYYDYCRSIRTMQPTSKPTNQPAKQRVLRWLCAPAVLITLSFVYILPTSSTAAEIYTERYSKSERECTAGRGFYDNLQRCFIIAGRSP